MRRSGKAASAGAALITALAAMSGGAAAAPPVHDTLEVDDTIVHEVNPCGFPIQVHVAGTERVSTHFDRDGEISRIRMHGQNLRVTFTNLDTGGTAEGHINTPQSIDVAEEGPDTVRITRLLGHFVVPGEGVVEHESGLAILVTAGPGDPDTTVVRMVGHLEGPVGPFPGVCDLLGGE